MRWVERDLGEIDYAYIVPISDLHIGDPLFNEEKFKSFVNWILNEPNAYVVLIGDLLDCATKDSVGDVYSATMTVQEAKKYAVKLLEPVKDRILAVVAGNHERRIWKSTGSDVTEDISLILGVPYDPHGILLNVKVGKYRNNGRLNYTIYVTHGTGASRTIGSKANVLKRASDIVLADIYIIGHIHFTMTFPDYYFVPDVRHRRVEKVKRLYVSVGGFLEWGGYSEDAMLAPTKTGTVRVRLSGERKDYHASV